MAYRVVDPARLTGADLEKWYGRSPLEIERERREAADQKHAEFVASIKSDERQKEPGPDNPIDALADAFHKWQHGPKIARPNVGEEFIPILGPAWEAAGDLQDGNYAGAAFNGVMAIADAVPVGVAFRGIRAASKGIGVLKKGSVTAEAARKALRRAGVTQPGHEIHHSVELNGIPRNAQDWRNHYAFLKQLPQAQHRRLHGSWLGAPRYDPIRRVWYGTTDWMKAVPLGVAAYVADAVENATQPSTPPQTSGSVQPPVANRLPRR